MLDNDDAQMFWACVKEEAEERYDWYPKITICDLSYPDQTTIKIVNNKLLALRPPSWFSPLEGLIVRARCRLISDLADHLCFAFHYAPKPMKASGDHHSHFYSMMCKGFSLETELRIANAIQTDDVKLLRTY